MLKQVFLELAESKQRAEFFAREREREVISSIPEYEEVLRLQNETGLSLARALLQTEDSTKVVAEYQEHATELLQKKAELLAEIGMAEADLLPKYSCMNCNDTGYRVDGKRCECIRVRLMKKEFARLNAEANLDEMSFQTFSLDYYPQEMDGQFAVVPREHMRSVARFLHEYATGFTLKSGNVLMRGETGLGKTHLSLAVAGKVLAKGHSVIYNSLPNLMGQIEREKFSGEGLEGKTLGTLLGADLLILDDLGTEFQSQFTSSMVYHLINTRLNRALPTIVSTNLTMSELEAQYTPRILSRLIGSYVSLQFMGHDIRWLKRVEEK